MKKLLITIFAAASSSLFCQIPAYVPTNGLMGYWPFTGNANDVSGFGNNGTINGALATADRFSVAGSAFTFNGSTNNIITNYVGITGTNPRAVSFWSRTAQSLTPMSAVAWGSFGTASRYEAGFNYGAPGPMLDGGNGAITYSTPNQFYDNAWHHYVLQFGNNSALSLVQVYYDGVLLTTPSNVYNGTNTLNTISASGFSVQFGSLPGTHYFNGDLDDIGIWNRPLTDCEINQLFTSTSPTLNVMTNSTICAGAANGSGTVIVSGMTPPFTYSWTPPVSTSSIATGLGIGTFSFVVSNAKQCTQSGNFSVIEKSCTSINTLNKAEQISTFPNPAHGTLYLKGLSEDATISLYNSLGIRLWLEKCTGNEKKLNISELAPGVYLLRVKEGETEIVKKIIIN